MRISQRVITPSLPGAILASINCSKPSHPFIPGQSQSDKLRMRWNVQNGSGNVVGPLGSARLTESKLP